MEELLYYVWQYKLFTGSPLETTNHLPVEVIDPGLRNQSSGPDFLNAKIKIDQTLWIGDIQVHSYKADNPAKDLVIESYPDSVILDVWGASDKSNLCDLAVRPIPQLILSYGAIIDRYSEFKKTNFQPRCLSYLHKVDRLSLHSWLEALVIERLEVKQIRIQELFESKQFLWQDILFITLARNFGFGVRGAIFECWAKLLPFRALDKHRDSLFQVEAIFFGLAGLLETDQTDRYMRELQDEFAFLRVKFNLRTSDFPWKLSSLRPGDFPHVRIAQLAWLYCSEKTLSWDLLNLENLGQVYKLLELKTSPYWETHVIFNRVTPSRDKRLRRDAKDLLIINTVIPFIYTYAKHKGDELKTEFALNLLSQLKPENNYITRLWRAAHIISYNAGDSQALIQLQKEYCDKDRCLACRIGFCALTR